MNRASAMAGAASLLLHAALAWFVLHPTDRRHMAGPVTEPPTLAVEFVDQVADTEGASAQAAPPPRPEPSPEAAAQPVRPEPAPDQAPMPQARQDAIPPPPDPARPVPQAPPSPQRVNLDGGEQDRASLLVTGDNVVPPRPDDTIRNRPPAYPADAARRHAQGTVGLVVHVTAAGIPGWVDVAESSGDTSLDEAARDAVALWRFRPATSGGLPVPFDFAYSIRFTLDGGRRRTNGQDRPRYDTGR